VSPLNLFIGVVSYSRTQFAISQGPQGLGRQLAKELTNHSGINTHIHIIDEDLDNSGVVANRRAVQRSLSAELHAEARYSKYISRPQYIKNILRLGARWTMRVKHSFNSPHPQLVSRLLNIEASHFDLMKRGLESESDYVLILEDDAFSSQLADLANGISGLMKASGTPAFVNLSESFSVSELGVGHLLTVRAGTSWQGDERRVVYLTSRPITNTVCAILYSRKFLAKVIQEMEALPLEPVLSIDWKLNVALMNLYEADGLGDLECWWVEPAPIKQKSMHI
jgi:hypothetical protein